MMCASSGGWRLKISSALATSTTAAASLSYYLSTPSPVAPIAQPIIDLSEFTKPGELIAFWLFASIGDSAERLDGH